LTDAVRNSCQCARRLAQFGPVALVLLLLVACSEGNGDADTQPSASPTPEPTALATIPASTQTEVSPSPPSTPVPRPTAPVTPTSSGRPAVLDQVIARAAEDYGVTPGTISVVSYEQQTWPTTALGCPEKGRFYAQIIITGYEFVLAIGESTAVYHADEAGTAIVRCVDGAGNTP